MSTMGKGNKHKRHKRAQYQPPGARQRDAGRTRGRGGAGRPRGGFDVGRIDEMIERAVASCPFGFAARGADEWVEGLARGPSHPDGPALVDRALGRALVASVTAAWGRGWQPADLPRVAARSKSDRHARLTVRAMGCEARRYGEATLPARWRLQLDAVGADPPADDRWAVAVGGASDLWGGVPDIAARAEAVRVAVETVGLIRGLPEVPKLAPGPGEGAPPRGARSARDASDGGRPGAESETPGADPRILHRVSSLLAKAESTTFPGEAESLSAKAQELMARYAIDMAAVDARRGRGPQVAGRRIGIDDPYARARMLLLNEVASANRCRAVWTQAFGFATVFGDEGDLDAVEMLFTSLLVQATRAMVSERPTVRATPPDTNAAATRSFRQSFLVAYAGRIGERLRQATEAAVTADREARGGDSLLPVLARRADAATAAAAAAFPHTRSFSTTARDPEGWAAGREAADRAQLGSEGALGDGPGGRPRSLGAA
jgi:hypothetical protein